MRLSAGAFNRENEELLREGLLSNELNKYVENNKKTHFKSVDYNGFSELFSKFNAENRKKNHQKNKLKEDEFMNIAKVNPRPMDLDPGIFVNPVNKRLQTDVLVNENTNEKIKNLTSMFPRLFDENYDYEQMKKHQKNKEKRKMSNLHPSKNNKSNFNKKLSKISNSIEEESEEDRLENEGNIEENKKLLPPVK